MRKDRHCLLGVLLCTVISNSALGQSRSDMIEQCAQLADLDLPDTTVTAASLRLLISLYHPARKPLSDCRTSPPRRGDLPDRWL